MNDRGAIETLATVVRALGACGQLTPHQRTSNIART